MSGASYRQTYRIERRERPLRPDEAQLVETRRRAWHAVVRKQETTHVPEMFVPFAVVVLLIALKDWRVSIAVGGVGTLFFGVLYVVARRKMLARLAAARGPWDAPERGFAIQETRVVARSVVGAVSGDEDYEHWLLYEIPNGHWFFVDRLCLPHTADTIEREELRLTRLWPHGVYLSIERVGEPIMRRGASGLHDDYARDAENGYVWRPADTESGADGFVSEADLPAWVRRVAAPDSEAH
jgi:hypothetical protein